MRWRVHDKPEVLPLLSRIKDLLASHGLLEGVGAAADFAIDDVIIFCDNGGDRSANGVLLEVVHNASDFTDLFRGVNGQYIAI
jgi:hypothetical protein